MVGRLWACSSSSKLGVHGDDIDELEDESRDMRLELVLRDMAFSADLLTNFVSFENEKRLTAAVGAGVSTRAVSSLDGVVRFSLLSFSIEARWLFLESSVAVDERVARLESGTSLACGLATFS